MQGKRNSRERTVRLTLMRMVVLAGLLMGCASDLGGGSVPGTTSSEVGPPSTWQAWTVVDVRHQQAVPLAPWLAELSAADVIYLGEEHHNHHHVHAALRILQALLDQSRRPVLGLEMFSWDGQAALDRQLSDAPRAIPAFLEDVKWTQNWGGAYEDYQPLVAFARENGLRVRALNAPRPLVRKVAKEGLGRIVELPEVLAWGMHRDEIVDDPAYRATIIAQLEACHGRGGAERDYQMMYEASLFRDEAMARTIAEEYAAAAGQPGHKGGPIVSYTGGGHIQYRLPIPQRVSRRLGEGLTQVTVYLMAYEPDRASELREWMERDIADFIWLTPIGAHGPPVRCR